MISSSVRAVVTAAALVAGSALLAAPTADAATPPSVRISDVTMNEGNSGNTDAVFNVSLSTYNFSPVSVTYSVGGGTATPGQDYLAQQGTLTFPAFTVSAKIRVPIVGDATVEPDETFQVTLANPVNATIADGTGLGTIRNDDTAVVPKYTLSVSRSGWSGTVSSSPAGINCGFDCSESYNSGTVVALTATPPAGQVLLGWSGACTGTGACSVTMDANKSVTASFGTPPPSRTLTVTKNGNGTVTSNPAGINCGSDCSEPYPNGTSVTLTAAAAAGFTFTGWSGACTGTATCTVTMDAAKTATATFADNRVQLQVGIEKWGGSSGGTVTLQPGNITCTETCYQWFDPGTVVTATATPNPDSYLNTWQGVCIGHGTCTVTMDAPVKTIIATFSKYPPEYSSINVTVDGGGTVTSDPAGIDCPSETGCIASFPWNSTVTLTATPGPDGTFTGWSGACSGTAPTCQVVADDLYYGKDVTATFTP